MKKSYVIIGDGLAALSAARTLAEKGLPSILAAPMPSERAQSVMAEGGINAALDDMDEGDTPRLHEEETWKAGRFLADKEAIHGLAEAAPGIVRRLYDEGTSFNLTPDGRIAQRPFGGQTRRRTAFASSSTGKQIMYTMTRAVLRFEGEGLITRMTGWRFLRLVQKDGRAGGVVLYNEDENRLQYLPAAGVIIAAGGMNGLFGNATGSVLNTGAVEASLFQDGVPLSNGEFIQYHPTTVHLHGKNMLITEAVRGEGGRLYILKDGSPCYFMEIKYPELGNLMPRDVVAREEWSWMKKGYQVYLDMSFLSQDVYENKLQSVISDCLRFMALDPRKAPIPVEPGIHYFMGGLYVDRHHRTKVEHLYAAGESACQYHGANRLGGNSLLGALYGGKVAAETAAGEGEAPSMECPAGFDETGGYRKQCTRSTHIGVLTRRLQEILRASLGIERNGEEMEQALETLAAFRREKVDGAWDEEAPLDSNVLFPARCLLGEALLRSALSRKESRGAHLRSDCPGEHEEYRKTTVASWNGKEVQIALRPIGESWL